MSFSWSGKLTMYPNDCCCSASGASVNRDDTNPVNNVIRKFPEQDII